MTLSYAVTFHIKGLAGELDRVMKERDLHATVRFTKYFHSATIEGFCNKIFCTKENCRVAGRVSYCDHTQNQLNDYVSGIISLVIQWSVNNGIPDFNGIKQSMGTADGKRIFFLEQPDLTFTI